MLIGAGCPEVDPDSSFGLFELLHEAFGDSFNYGPVIPGKATYISSLEHETPATIRARCVRLIEGKA